MDLRNEKLVPPPVLASFLAQQIVIGRIDDHRDAGVVFCSRAQHSRSADVDVLDAFVVGAALRKCCLEGIEIDHEADRWARYRAAPPLLMFLVAAAPRGDLRAPSDAAS